LIAQQVPESRQTVKMARGHDRVPFGHAKAKNLRLASSVLAKHDNIGFEQHPARSVIKRAAANPRLVAAERPRRRLPASPVPTKALKMRANDLAGECLTHPAPDLVGATWPFEFAPGPSHDGVVESDHWLGDPERRAVGTEQVCLPNNKACVFQNAQRVGEFCTARPM
jgi:hypothetical protein